MVAPIGRQTSLFDRVRWVAVPEAKCAITDCMLLCITTDRLLADGERAQCEFKIQDQQHAVGNGRLRPRCRYLVNWTKHTHRLSFSPIRHII